MLYFLETTAAEGDWTSMLPTIGLLVVLGLMLFFMFRGQKKQEKEAAAMRNSIEIGDEVTTIGGIIGQVVGVKGETFTLVTTKDKTKIRFLKTAIRSVDVKANGQASEQTAASVTEPLNLDNK